MQKRLFMWKSLISLCSRRKRPLVVCPVWLDSISTLPDLEAMARTPESVDKIKLRNLLSGLDIKAFRFPNTSYGRIGYVPLVESNQFTLCMFYLPKGAILPFHDHPHQHVCLRVLAGELQIDSCDISSDYQVRNRNSTVVNSESMPCLVEPDNDNIHQIKALKESLFLDFVLPPYSAERAITYFRESGERLEPVQEKDIGLNMDFCDVRTLV
jgi:hypothetical protein